MANFVKLEKYVNLSSEACHTLVLGLVMPHLDYANGLLCSSPKNTMQPYRRIQNMCAKLILSRSKYDSSSDALKELHWLPIQGRVDYKILFHMYQCTHGTAPTYLKETLKKPEMKRKLHSISRNDNYVVPYNKKKAFGDHDHLVSMDLMSGTNYQPP